MTATLRDTLRSRAALAATLAAAAMIANHVGGRAARDALFLANFPVEKLPYMMVTAAVLSMLTLIASSRAMARYAPARLVPAAFAVSGLLFVVPWWLSGSSARVAAVAIYLQIAVFGPFLISAFWSLVNERFDPHAAKRVIGVIGAGATLGGVAGGLLAGLVSRLDSVRPMLLVLAGLNLVAFAATAALCRKRPIVMTSGGGSDFEMSGVRILRTTPYLRDLASLVTLVALTSVLLDYVLRAEVTVAFPEEAQLLGFFAAFYTATSVVSFALQAVAGQPALARLGLAGTVALLPLSVVGVGLVGSLIPALWRAVALRAVDATLQNSLFRSGYELFYTPLAPEKKRPTKSLIDVGFDRVGQIVGSGVVLAVLWMWADGSGGVLVSLAVLAALAALLLSARLHRGYVDALAHSLQSSQIELVESKLVDQTTRTVWESSVSLSRSRILAAIEASSEFSGAAVAVSSPGAEPVAPAPEAADPVVVSIARLRAGVAEEVAAILSAPIDPTLTAHVLPLLADDRLYTHAMRALRRIAGRVTGQLVDAMVDPSSPYAVRRRLPRVLQACRTQRAIDGLMLALDDVKFSVRYHAARGLGRLREEWPEGRFDRAAVFAAAGREIERGRSAWDEGFLDGDDDELAKIVRDRTTRSLSHVFRILSLALDSEPLWLAFSALGGDDRAARGTALEYLENVLPPDIRSSLWPYLGVREPARRAPLGQRTREQIVDELRMTQGAISIAEIRRALAGSSDEEGKASDG